MKTTKKCSTARFIVEIGILVKYPIICEIKCFALKHKVNVQTERLHGWFFQTIAFRLTGVAENVRYVSDSVEIYLKKIEVYLESSNT